MNDAFNRSNSILLDRGIEKVVRGVVSIQDETGYLLGMWDDGQTFEQEAQSIIGRCRNSQSHNYSPSSHSSAHYSKSVNESATTINNSKGSSLFAIVFGILACLALFFVLIYPEIDWDGKVAAASKAAPTPTPYAATTHVNSVVFPTNGHYDIRPENTTGYQLYGEDYAQPAAPFKVTVPNTYKYYCVQLYDHLNGKKVVSLYVHGGQTVEIDVPFGSYKLYYSGGDIWYGPTKRFLEAGAYWKSDDLLEFYEDGDYACGVELELQVYVGGNMDSSSVSYDNFPN